MEVWVPCMIRDHWSRPRRSDPSRKIRCDGSSGPISLTFAGMTPRTLYAGPSTKNPIRTLRLGSAPHSMRNVTGLRLPTTPGTHGDQRPSSKIWTDWIGMKAWRASVRSGSWVLKKSGQSTTR